jgi:hypothetical protein
VKREPQTTRLLLILWSIHVAAALLSSTIPLNETIKAPAALAASVIIMHTTNTYTFKELCDTLKTAINTILHKNKVIPKSRPSPRQREGYEKYTPSPIRTIITRQGKVSPKTMCRNPKEPIGEVIRENRNNPREPRS